MTLLRTVAILPLLLLLATPQSGLAASSDWSVATGIPAGRAVQVTHGKQITSGAMVSASADRMVVRTKRDGEVAIARADVRRIWITGHRRGRNVAIGAGIGAGVMLLPGLFFRAYLNNETGGGDKAMAISLAIGAGLGAALGSVGGGRELVYKAAKR